MSKTFVSSRDPTRALLQGFDDPLALQAAHSLARTSDWRVVYQGADPNQATLSVLATIEAKAARKLPPWLLLLAGMFGCLPLLFGLAALFERRWKSTVLALALLVSLPWWAVQADRIRRLDPQFDPRQYVEIAKRWSAPVDVLALDAELGQTGVASLSNGSAALPGRVLPTATAEQSVSPAQVLSQVGNPAADDYRTADRIHREIPKVLRDAARSQTSAMETVFALLIDADASITSRQLSLIASHAGAAAMAGTEDLLAIVATLHPMSRLPLAAMAFPAIRRFPRQNLQQFVAVLELLIHADGKTGLFEYCLAKLIGMQVSDALDPPHSGAIGKRKLVDCQTSVVRLFSVLSGFGHDDEAGAQRAFNVGINAVYRQTAHRYAMPADWVSALDSALPELNRLDSTGKELLIEAMVSAIATDNQVAVGEAELLRVICAALHCPLPPLLSVA